MRAAGAMLGLAFVQVADALGVWVATGTREDLLRVAFAVLGATLATSTVGAVLWALLGGAMLVLGVATYTPLVAPLVPAFVRDDPPGPPPDAIVVFSGSVSSAGRLHGDALDRLLDALQTAAARRIPALGLSVVADERDPRTPPSERDQRALVAIARPGLEPHFVRDVHSTRDEALAFAALARSQRWRRILAITSPLHTRRACSALEVAGLAVECRAAAARGYDIARLDLPGNRRAAFADVLYETAATWLYRSRGWMR